MFRNVNISRVLLVCLSLIIGSGQLLSHHHEKSKSNAFKQVPFEIVNDLIIVRASCNGQWGNYIFDTGASDLILNKEIEHANPESGSGSDIIGVFEAKTRSTVAFVREFKLGEVTKENFRTSSLDLSHIEEALNTNIDGLIGMGFFRDNNVLIDYNNRSIGIYNADDDLEEHISTLLAEKPIVLRYDMSEGLPSIDCSIGDLDLHMGIDLGSSITILDEKYEENLSLGVLETIQLNGSADRNKCEKHSIPSMRVKQTALLEKSETLFVDLSHLRNADVNIDGIIGVDLIKDKIMLIQGKKNSILLWDASHLSALAAL